MKSTGPDLQTLEAAATWYVELHDGAADPARQLAWQRWLAASPAHAAAWARVQRLQQQWAQLAPQAALSGLRAAQARRREVLKLLSLLMAVGGAGWLAAQRLPYQALLARQRTAIGERRSLQLSDGSALELNSATALDIDYSETLRALHLYAGEVFIRTAADPARRPFIVHTESGSVRALGTEFHVRQHGQQTQVGVLKSAVQLRALHHPERVLRLEAGQQARFDRDSLGLAEPLPADATAWRQGMLSVNDWPLAALLQELGRYRPGVLRCAAAVRSLRISGAFSVDDTDIALANLPRSLPVTVRYFSRYWVSVEPA